jgi:tetratricopeptide (TPR) repeat protein
MARIIDSTGSIVSCVATVPVLILLGSVAGSATGQEHHAGHSVGTVNFPISCSEQAQGEFNRALALLHHMTYPQAGEAFRHALETDPECAMAHWGIAMTLFQPLWPTRPSPEELQKGWEAVQKARDLGTPTERERLFVDAAAAFFSDPASPDYWSRIHRWEEAMATLHNAIPQDYEAAAFYALAHLATAPSDVISRAHSDRAAVILLALYERNPDHPGVMHYLVHANDVPGRERESLEIVRKYEKVAPRNPHALHMPTHIYTRLGDWESVIKGNIRAAEAALEHPAGDQGQFVWDEFPHAIEYLVYAHLQRGDDDEAAAQLRRLQGTANLQPSFKTAFHTASTQARYALERRAWGEARALVPRDPAFLDWDRFMWPEAVTWFALGLGATHEGELEEARRAKAHLESLAAATSDAGEKLFARNIRVLHLTLGAWIAHAGQDSEGSVALMQEAVELETSTPKHAVTPGPTLPAVEILGDLLLEQAQPVEALAAYEHSLKLYPRRFNSLLGAARAARASGDDARARAFYVEFLELADGSGRVSALGEARAFLSQSP